MHYSKYLPGSLLVLCALQTPSFAHAQNSDEIIVTATKVEKQLQKVPASVNIVDAVVLAQLDSAEDITRHVPELQAAIANGSQVIFQIRGIGAVDHQALTPTSAAVYADGTFLATNVQTSPLLFDLERMEVLKGPQGSLYGRNASSGAINFISVRPGDVAAGYIQGEYGSYDRVGLKGGATLPISDIFSLRVSGRYLSQGPLLENVVTNSAISAPLEGGGKTDEFGLKALGLLKVSPQTDVLFNVHYGEDNGINVAPRNDSLDIGRHEISIGPDGIQDTDNEFYGVSTQITHQAGPTTLFSHSAYEGYNQQYGFDFDGTPAPFNVESLNSNLRYDRDFTQVSQELRASYVSNNHEIMLGGYFEAEDFDQEYILFCGVLNPATLLGTCRYVGAPGRAGPTPASSATATTLRSLISQSRKTAAIFTNNTVGITSKLDLVVGARLSHETIKARGEGRHYFDDGIIALNNRDGLGLAIGDNEISDTRLSGNIGLSYAATDNLMAYASYSNGFKSGGFNGEVINNATHFSDEGLFKAETVDSLEAGLKYKIDTFRFNTSAFYQFYDHPQARIFVPFSTGTGGSFTSNSLSNLDKATSFGIETDVRWTPIERLDLRAGATWLDTEIEQSENPNVPQNAAAFNGNPLPFASDVSLTGSVRYEIPLTTTIRASLAANGKYQSAFYFDAEGLDTRRQSGYETIDASANLHFTNGWDIGIWGRNLTASDHAVSGFGFIGYNTFSSAPRSYGLALKYQY